MTPAGVVHLIRNNHEVFIQKGAGLGSGFTDAQYVEAERKLLIQLKKLGTWKWL